MKRYLALKKIIELGSFSKAAESLGYTQSATSQMISSLEDELSIKLLKRSRTGVSLTTEGMELYPYIESTINSYLIMQERAKNILGLDSGVIRIGTIASISEHWLPSLIKEFKTNYPNVDFIIHQGDYTSIPEWIRTGEIDFGFINPAAISSIRVSASAKNWTLETLKNGAMLAVLPEGHPLASLDKIPLDRLTVDPFILLEEGHYSEPLEAFHAEGLSPNVKYRIHDDFAIMTMVEAGLGISILAELILHRTNYRIVTRPTEPFVQRTIAIAYKDKRSLPMASWRFIEYLRSRVDQLP